MNLTNLLDLSNEELHELIKSINEPAFRAEQIWHWIWVRQVKSIEGMKNLPKTLKEKLEELSHVFHPQIVSRQESTDGTVKFLLALKDGKEIETVLIPGKKRYTLCLSSQVGCAMACTFCATGLMGFERNLTAGEILGQILIAKEYVDTLETIPLKNLVFMGMGEPLLNLENVLKAMQTLKSPKGLYFSSRRIMLSTVGFPDELYEFSETGFGLPAVSLHAPNQALREQIMPKAAKAFPIHELIESLHQLPLRDRERITYEYLLLKGVNDSLEHAKELADLLKDRKCKINLIVYNAVNVEHITNSIQYKTPDEKTVLAFEKYLWDRGMTCTLRKSMGKDIAAACGQLKANDRL